MDVRFHLTLVTGVAVLVAGVCFVSFAYAADGSDKTISELRSENKALVEENRKLASALADATQKLLGIGGSDFKPESIKKAGSHSGESCMDEMTQVINLKETIRQLQAQNEHLSSSGSMGKTATAQIISLQEENDELQADIDQANEVAEIYKQKIQEYERDGACPDRVPLEPSCAEAKQDLTAEIMDLKIKNQDMQARIDMLEKKAPH